MFLSCLLLLLPLSIARHNYHNQSLWPSTCNSQSSRQSPINIPCRDFINICPPDLKYHVHWNDPVIQIETQMQDDLRVNFKNANSWVLLSNNTNDYIFISKQFHFHSPSEHSISGHHFPLQMQIVYQLQSQDVSEFLVIAIFIQTDPTISYDCFQSLLSPNSLTKPLLFPFPVTNRPAYYYQGSLTTPPCSQNVHWLLQTQPIKITTKHTLQLQRDIHEGKPNNRIQQRLRKRVISLVGSDCPS